MIDLTLNKLINACEELPAVESAVCFIGSQNKGKSLICELLKKYVDRQPHPDLTFEAGRTYQLDGVISSKSLKPFTLTPHLYIVGKLSVLDVPAFLLSPETKKWTSFQTFLMQHYLFKKVNKASFVAVVDEVQTRGPKMEALKKTLLSFVTEFPEPTGELLSAVSILVNKNNKPDVNESSCLSRLKLTMDILLKSESKERFSLISTIYESIDKNSRMFVMDKCTGNEQKEEELILKLFESMQSVPSCDLQKVKLNKDCKLEKEDEESVGRYIKTVARGLNILFTMGCSIRQQQSIKDLNDKLGDQIEEICEGIQHPVQKEPNVIYLTWNTKKEMQSLEYYLSYFSILSEMNKFQQGDTQTPFHTIFLNFVNKLDLGQLAKHFSNNKIIKLISNFLQFTNLIEKTQLRFDFEPILNECEEFYSESERKDIQNELVKSFKENQSMKFYEGIVFGARYLQGKDMILSLKELQMKCSLCIIELKQPGEGLTTLLQFIHENKAIIDKNNYHTYRLFRAIGALFANAAMYHNSGEYYQRAGYISQALTSYELCLHHSHFENINETQKYLDYFCAVKQHDTARRLCYKLGERYDTAENREQLFNQLRRIQSNLRESIATKDLAIEGQQQFLQKTKLTLSQADLQFLENVQKMLNKQ